jgi:hypothetical protein
MQAEDKQRLKELTAALPPGSGLRLTLNKHAQREAFQAFGRDLQALAPGIDLLTEVTGEAEPPCLETTSGIRFQALPEGDKLDSFVDALRPAAPHDGDLPATQHDLLRRMRLPAEVRLYIAPGCPFCPRALAQWVALAKAGDLLRLRVVDCTLFPETVAEEKIKGVPTLILDDQLRWSGTIPVTDVLEQLVNRDPRRLSAEAMNGIIQEGQAGQLARAMLESGSLFPGVVDLLTHDKWPVRLGAMVIMEEIVAANPLLAAEAAPVLRQRYGNLDDPVRGDVLYTIGATGDHRNVPFLENISRTSANPEIHQAALEALASLRDRNATS